MEPNRGETSLSFGMLEDAEFYFVCLGFLSVTAESRRKLQILWNWSYSS